MRRHSASRFTSEYLGPLRFDDPDDDSDGRLRAALLLDDQWRWLRVNRTGRHTYAFDARLCSRRCETLMLIALQRHYAERRAH